jgi:hypothetical protein
VLAYSDRLVRTTDTNADAVAHRLHGPRLARAVKRDRLHAEADNDPAAVGACISCRKVAQDAVSDRMLLGLNADGFGDRKVAVAFHRDVADEA